MSRRTAILLVVGLLSFLAFAAWFDVTGRDGAGPGPAAVSAASATPAPAPTAAVKTPAPAQNAVFTSNRAERTGRAWTPSAADKQGKPLQLGRIVPGALQPVVVGANVQTAVNAGYLERDPKREQACEGTFWKWTGGLAQGLDVLVDQNRRISALGMSRPGLETAEGISVGNSFGALVQTYGDRLQGPVRMDYGQAGAFVQDGDAWIGFGMDNQPGQLADDSRIAFIEVTKGARPGLLRDGC